MRVLGVVFVLAVSGCAKQEIIEPMQGTKLDQTHFKEAEHYCRAFSQEDLEKDFRKRFIYCMAEKGWRVTYQ